MDRESVIVREVPLYTLLGDDLGAVRRLRYEIEHAAREFGYHQIGLQAEKFGAATIHVRLEIRQPWEPVE